MPDNLNVNILRQWHDTKLLAGGKTQDVKKVRVMIGEHGPYEWSFDRDATSQVIGDTIRAQKRELEDLART